MDTFLVQIIRLGDFNCPEIEWSDLSVKHSDNSAAVFLYFYKESHLSQVVDFVTRFRNDQSSLLELVMISDKQLIYKITEGSPLGLSDHVVKAYAQLATSAKHIHLIPNWPFAVT